MEGSRLVWLGLGAGDGEREVKRARTVKSERSVRVALTHSIFVEQSV